MATDDAKLVIELEARIRDFERNFAKANKTANDNWRGIEARGSQAAKKLETTFADATKNISNSLNAPLLGGGIAAAVAAKQIQQLADAWTSAGNKIKAAGINDAMAEAARVDVSDIAQRSRTDFNAVADLYARLTRTGKDLGKSQGEVTVATETVAKALKLTGASAQETESTLVQLGQALGSGRLQGDELRSLLENAPLLARAIGKEFNVTVGELKSLGEQGQLVSGRVFDALVKAAPEISRAFAGTTATISDSFKSLEAAATRFVGQSGQVSAASKIVSGVIGGLANNFDTVASGAVALGAVLASRLIGAGLTPLVASMGVATATSTAGAAALGAVGIAGTRAAGGIVTASMAARALGGAFALLGGVPGAIILGIVSAIGYFSTKANEGGDVSARYAKALDEVRASADRANPAIRETGNAVDEVNRRMAQAPVAQAQAGLDATSRAAETLKIQIAASAVEIEKFSGKNIGADEKARLVELLNRALKDDADAAIQAAAEIERLGRVNPSFEGFFASTAGVLQRLGQIIAQAGAARIALAAAKDGAVSNDAAALARKEQTDLFKAGVQPVAPATDMINADPVIARIKVQRQVALAEMDETKRKIQEKQKAIYEQSLRDGGGLTLDEAGKAAQRIVAAEGAGRRGGGGGSGAEKRNDFDREEASMIRRTRATEAEARAIGLSTFEAAKAEASFRLLDSAQQAGIPITEELGARVDRLAASYATAKLHVEEAAQAVRAMDGLRSTIGDALGSFASDMRRGVDAATAFNNALGRIADRIQSILINKLVEGLFGGTGTSGGGIFGNIFGTLFGVSKLASGGHVRGPGTGTSDSIPALLSNGEFVVRASQAERFAPLLTAINDGKVARFADGGRVGGTIAASGLGKGAGSVTYKNEVTVNVQGGAGTPEQNSDLAAKIGKTMRSQLEAMIDQRMLQHSRAGGMLRR